MKNARESYPTPPTPGTKTCRFCKQGGFVWYFTESSRRWMLAEPKEGTLDPNPLRVHFCPVLAERQALRAVVKSYKPNTWRRGKSPGSYG